MIWVKLCLSCKLCWQRLNTILDDVDLDRVNFSDRDFGHKIVDMKQCWSTKTFKDKLKSNFLNTIDSSGRRCKGVCGCVCVCVKVCVCLPCFFVLICFLIRPCSPHLICLLIVSSISCVSFILLFDVRYWNKVWYDMIWHDMIWHDMIWYY